MSHINSWTRASARKAVGADVLDRPGVLGAAMYSNMIRLFGPGCRYATRADLPEGWDKIYEKTEKGSRTKEALAMLEADPTLTQYEVAKRVGVDPACITRARQRAARAAG